MINSCLRCDLPCGDVNKDFIVPKADVQPGEIRLAMISESPPPNSKDYYYQSSSGSFFGTTQTALGDAGCLVENYADISRKGIYLTTAIKCSKRGYLVKADTLKRCSGILEMELAQFGNLRIVMCMGDFAIKAVNYISKRRFKTLAIPSGSTYKIRQGTYELNGIRYFPSYTQTGESFDVERGKRTMIAEDIRKALSLLE